MNTNQIHIRNAKPEEFNAVGSILIDVYSSLPGFPNKEVHPTYYEYLQNVGPLSLEQPIELIVAVSETVDILGCVVFYHDVKYYNSGGTVTQQKNCCGFRLLAVTPKARGLGIGKKLTNYCIDKAKSSNSEYLIIHTTNAMRIAWKMYNRMGFKRAEDLDFTVGELEVFGFRYPLI